MSALDQFRMDLIVFCCKRDEMIGGAKVVFKDQHTTDSRISMSCVNVMLTVLQYTTKEVQEYDYRRLKGNFLKLYKRPNNCIILFYT
jgi:hypothetical protein